MRTFTIRALAMGALAMLTFAGSAASQTASSPILNALEVRMLVASTEPWRQRPAERAFRRSRGTLRSRSQAAHVDVAELRRQPESECGRGHERALQAPRGAQHGVGGDGPRARGASPEAGEGLPRRAPRGAARFQGGAGAPEPSDQELRALAAKASTPADHRALEEYFLTLAKRHTADANEHVAIAQSYRGTRIAQAAVHCDRLVALSRDSAKEATAAAAMHKALAGLAR